MEVNTTTVASSGPFDLDGKNHTNKQHLSNSQPYHHHHHGFFLSKSALIVIIPTISVMVILSIIFILLMLRRLAKSTKTNGNIYKETSLINTRSRFIAQTTVDLNSSPDVKGGCLQGGNSGRSFRSPALTTPSRYKGVQVFSYKELEEATDKFSEANVIGHGGFGVVYKGVLRDGTVATIKMLRREGRQGERAFRVEVDLLSRLHSPYLVELLGYCADQHHRLLIFECMPHGTLQRHLHPTNNHQPLDWGTRLKIALDCAKALEFLHEHATPSVIHRDFKCTNVLLDQNFCAKVSDFGLAKVGSDKINGQISTRVRGTTGYLAPEYASTGKLTTRSDVFSYGVLLLELLTGRVPIDTKRPPGEHVLVLWALPRLTSREKVLEMVDPVLQGQFSQRDLIQIAAIAAMCVQPEAEYRPLMTDVVPSLIPLVRNSCYGASSGSSRFLKQTPSPRY
ncbi:probable serine/threonine-protein kinase PBL7 [Pyrus x bretschneideri]|uniref:probable serine/threonine-protein kinase PBL7 n=1 Tax=Pyrus x bretschneideri TaxID=225117 RepID=UPI00202F4ECF|nr:probable serine/threonine-protein kinase PBL7 [Pyrus x bretschneideri]